MPISNRLGMNSDSLLFLSSIALRISVVGPWVADLVVSMAYQCVWTSNVRPVAIRLCNFFL
jgi:hypothetical protein